jgi:hypothetical protein
MLSVDYNSLPPHNGAADEPPAGRPLADWTLNEIARRRRLYPASSSPASMRSNGPLGPIVDGEILTI